MKQTAVEWLLENLISEPHSEEDFNYNSECWDRALEMEKEQINDAAKIMLEGKIILFNSTEIGDRRAEQYYNKTFNKKA